MSETPRERVLADLQAYRLEREAGDDQWRADCPWRPGSDSHGFTIGFTGDWNGGWTDWPNGQERGGLEEYYRRRGWEWPRREVEDSKRGYRDLDDYAREHGLEDGSAFRKGGWREETVDGRAALVFKTASGERVRFIDGRPGSTYKSMKKGYKNCWYGLRGAIELSSKSGLPLILVNGEASTVVAQHYGIPACAVTGGEKGRLDAEHLNQLLEAYTGEIVVAYDCDETGRKASIGVRNQLQQAGREARWIDLGFSKGGDFANLCKLYTSGTADRVREILGKPEPEMVLEAVPDAVTLPEPSAPQKSPMQVAEDLQKSVKRFNDIVRSGHMTPQEAVRHYGEDLLVQVGKLMDSSDPLKPVTADTMIDALHKTDLRAMPTGLHKIDRVTGGLPYGNVTYIYGAPGMGKSTLAATIAANFEVSVHNRGLYITTETTPVNFMRAIVAAMSGVHKNAIAAGLYASADEGKRVARAKDAVLANGSIYLDAVQPSLSALERMVLRAADGDVTFIMVDSISRLVDASNYEMVARANNLLQHLARKTGLPLLATTQVSRDIENRTLKIPRLSDAYGGAVIEQNAEVVMALYRHQYYVDRKLEEAQPRNFPPDTVCVVMQKVKQPLVDNVEGGRVTLAYRQGVGMSNYSGVVDGESGDYASSEREGVERPQQRRAILIDETVNARHK